MLMTLTANDFANSGIATNRKPYPSDIGREQFEQFRNMPEGIRHKTQPRRIDVYDEFFCASLYLLKNASVWRALPLTEIWWENWRPKRLPARRNASTCSTAFKHLPFSGGTLIRTPALMLGMVCYRLRDVF
jgi:hypothetical protein